MSVSDTAPVTRSPDDSRECDEGAIDAPASYSQQALWYLNRAIGEPEAYNITGAFSVTGPIDAGTLTRVLAEIVARHEPLRTSFLETDGGVVQRVGEVDSKQLTTIDLTSTSPDQHDDVAQHHIRAEAARPFDLSSAQMLRATLLRLSDEQHVFILVIHHIACDGRSIEVLMQEILRLYEAYSDGEPSPLAELSMSYTAYARWQRQMFELGAWDEHQDYWREQLAGGIEKLRLPMDKPSNGSDSLSGAACHRTLNGSLAASVQQFCSDEGVTPFVLMLAVYQTLLARYGAAREVCVSTPVDGRIRPELDSLVGLFVNTLVIRASVDDNPTFKQLLHQVRDRVFDAYEHQMTHLDASIARRQRHEGPRQMVQPQAAFTYEKQRLDSLQMGGSELRRIEVPLTTSKFDLFMSVVGVADRFDVTINYRDELFSQCRAEQLLDHFENLLRSAVDSPEQTLWELPMINSDEQQRLIQLAQGPIKSDACADVLRTISLQAKDTPTALAVESHADTLTYRQWTENANRLARYLTTLGVTQGSRVAICLDRSVELPVAILAILKAGAAFIPLDPDYPSLRLANMLADSGADVLISRSDLIDRCRDFDGRTVLLDEQTDAIAQNRCDDVQITPQPTDVAYLMFTSGSTGSPKAIAIQRGALSNYVRGMHDRLNIVSTDRVCQFASISFDAAIKEMFLAWSAGAALVFRPSEPFATIEQFNGFLDRKRISVVNLPASFWHEWVDHMSHRGLSLPEHLRLLIVGGEPSDLARLRTWRTLAPDVRWVNTYGPTEATINATTLEVADDDAIRYTNRVPIGRPLDNVSTYVLDRSMQPVPVGATGELCIGGSGVAEGYVNDAELTQRQFLADRFASDSRKRLYRSGDLARWLPDGNLELLGRIDDQIKLRGFRIEPGEIETTLRSHPSVRDALVTTELEDDVPVALVAAVIPNNDTLAVDPTLRQYLVERLAAHMIPARIVAVGRLPRNANGKVHRDLLRSIIASPLAEEDRAKYVAPRNETETKLSNIWTSLLNQDELGINDDFFERGGNSLLALRMFAEVEEEFDVHLPLASLAQHATIEKLASLVTGDRKASNHRQVYELQAHGTRPPIFAIPGIGGDVLQFAALAQIIDQDQPLFGIEAVGCDDGEEPLPSIQEIARLYIRNVRDCQPQGPYYLAGYSFGGTVAYEMAQQLTAAGETIGCLVLIDTGSPTYGRRHFKWIYIARFMKHFPRWFIQDYIRSDWHHIWIRPFRLLQLVARRVADKVFPRRKRTRRVDVDAALYAPDIPDMYKKVIETHYGALRDYQVQPYAGKITLLRSSVSGLFGSLEEDLGWSDVARGGVQVEVVSGAHLTMLDEPHVAALAAKLSRAVHEAHCEQEENSPVCSLPTQSA